MPAREAEAPPAQEAGKQPRLGLRRGAAVCARVAGVCELKDVTTHVFVQDVARVVEE